MGASYQELDADSYHARERDRLRERAAAVEAGEIADLKAKLAEARRWVRATRREADELDARLRYDAYVDCITCFPYRDFEAAAAAHGEHTCGLSAAERLAITAEHFAD